MNQTLNAAFRGVLAGTVATLPMSAVMFAANKAGLLGEYPPEVITGKALDEAGIEPPEDVNDAAATAAHLGFGAATGALFEVLRRRMDLPVSPVAQGIAYGLLVYTVSYAGWLPAIHIMPVPEHDRPGRQPSMMAAHIVYGAALGALTE